MDPGQKPLIERVVLHNLAIVPLLRAIGVLNHCGCWDSHKVSKLMRLLSLCQLDEQRLDAFLKVDKQLELQLFFFDQDHIKMG